jgi:hypothetical protein
MVDDPNTPRPARGRRLHPEQWTTGDEPMTAAQAAYLQTLCREANEPFAGELTKAEASTRIDTLRRRTGRADARTGAAPAVEMEVRAPEEVFVAHLHLRGVGAVEDDLRENFDPHVIVLASNGVHRGHDGVRYLLLLLREDLPDATFSWRTALVDGEVALLEWEARTPGGHVEEGVDSYVIRGGRIVAMTMSFQGWR